MLPLQKKTPCFGVQDANVGQRCGGKIKSLLFKARISPGRSKAWNFTRMATTKNGHLQSSPTVTAALNSDSGMTMERSTGSSSSQRISTLAARKGLKRLKPSQTAFKVSENIYLGEPS